MPPNRTRRPGAPLAGPGFGVAMTSSGSSGWRVHVEHFADGSRNGVRIRQLGFGDPAITTTPARNELVVGGSNVGCEAAGETLVVARMAPRCA
jgi:hypothetical protein